jgi:hypothetical protein
MVLWLVNMAFGGDSNVYKCIDILFVTSYLGNYVNAPYVFGRDLYTLFVQDISHILYIIGVISHVFCILHILPCWCVL